MARVGLAVGVLVPLIGVLAPVDVEPQRIAADQSDEKQPHPQASREHPARLQRPQAAVTGSISLASFRHLPTISAAMSRAPAASAARSRSPRITASPRSSSTKGRTRPKAREAGAELAP